MSLGGSTVEYYIEFKVCCKRYQNNINHSQRTVCCQPRGLTNKEKEI